MKKPRKKVSIIFAKGGLMKLDRGELVVVTKKTLMLSGFRYHVFVRFGHIGCDLNSDEILVVGK